MNYPIPFQYLVSNGRISDKTLMAPKSCISFSKALACFTRCSCPSFPILSAFIFSLNFIFISVLCDSRLGMMGTKVNNHEYYIRRAVLGRIELG